MSIEHCHSALSITFSFFRCCWIESSIDMLLRYRAASAVRLTAGIRYRATSSSDSCLTWYTKGHEWVSVDVTRQRATVGVTGYPFACDEPSSVIVTELPEPGAELETGDTLCYIDGTKVCFKFHSPACGTVIETNQMQLNSGAFTNDPEGRGWLIKLDLSRHPFDAHGLLTRAEYDARFCQGLVRWSRPDSCELSSEATL